MLSVMANIVEFGVQLVSARFLEQGATYSNKTANFNSRRRWYGPWSVSRARGSVSTTNSVVASSALRAGFFRLLKASLRGASRPPRIANGSPTHRGTTLRNESVNRGPMKCRTCHMPLSGPRPHFCPQCGTRVRSVSLRLVGNVLTGVGLVVFVGSILYSHFFHDRWSSTSFGGPSLIAIGCGALLVLAGVAVLLLALVVGTVRAVRRSRVRREG